MTMGWSAPRKAAAALALAAMGAGGFAAPAMAQDQAQRVKKLEAEVSALQRAVFPGGDQRFFPPEVTPGSQAQPITPAVAPPSASALTDVLARLDALEGQVSRLTAQSEVKGHQLSELQKRFDDAQAALAAQAAPPAGPAPSGDSAGLQPTGVVPVPSIDRGPVTPASVHTRGPTRPGRAARGDVGTDSDSPRLAQPETPAPRTGRSAPSGTSAGPSAARLAAVRAIVKPQTSDAGDDEYTYGFRLFGAGFYPEARQQLSLYLQKYPQHREVSLGRNLLGRAYLDDGQPREAAKYFFDNYQSNKNGARAADSLLNLAEAMIAINDTGRACIALAEFGDTYPAIASGRLKEQYDRTKSKVHCTR